MNICPAYRHIGGHGYGSIYSGPIGAVISPLLGGYEDFHDLPYACSLCQACNTVCPVKIPLAQLITKHRQVMVESRLTPNAERRFTQLFNYVNAHPTLWKVGMSMGARMANLMIKNGNVLIKANVLNNLLETRDLPTPDGEGFRHWFKNHKAEGKK